MPDQKPSLSRDVHYVRSGEHLAAKITAVYSREIEDGKLPIYGQTLRVWPPMDEPFNVVASYDVECSDGTWHWPEYVA